MNSSAMVNSERYNRITFELTESNRELATRILRDVSYEERIIGQEMSGTHGNDDITLYNLQEVADFLHVDAQEDLMATGGGASIGYIDLNELQTWIAKVLGDVELANAVGEEILHMDSYAVCAESIKAMLTERLRQCHVLLSRLA